MAHLINTRLQPGARDVKRTSRFNGLFPWIKTVETVLNFDTTCHRAEARC